MRDLAKTETASGLETRHAFQIFRHKSGRWCAQRIDGLVAGVFFLREAAVRFADDENRFGRAHGDTIANSNLRSAVAPAA